MSLALMAEQFGRIFGSPETGSAVANAIRDSGYGLLNNVALTNGQIVVTNFAAQATGRTIGNTNPGAIPAMVGGRAAGIA